MTDNRILIVDDEQRTLLFLRESLLISGLNAELACVSTPEAALEAFRRQSFDLLIADICLVGMDGVELLSQLRKRQPGLPAILVSGQASPSLEKHLHTLDGVRYFRKPFAFEEFTAAVAEALQEPRPAAAEASQARPDWQLESIRRHLSNLLQDSGAQSACLTDAKGSVITHVGDQALNLDSWTAPPDVGGSFNFTYYQGRTHDMYSATVENDVYLVITFDRERPAARIGQVLQYTRRAAQAIAHILLRSTNSFWSE